jgi:hypothetical protein
MLAKICSICAAEASGEMWIWISMCSAGPNDTDPDLEFSVCEPFRLGDTGVCNGPAVECRSVAASSGNSASSASALKVAIVLEITCFPPGAKYMVEVCLGAFFSIRIDREELKVATSNGFA